MELATRGQRFKAFLLDAVIMGFFYLLMNLSSDGVGVVGLIGALAMLGVQFWLLTKDGQSVGKRIMAIRIVKKETGENGGFVTNVLLRSIVNGILGIIPLYFIADSLLIFRDDRRCIHDFIAGTVVVQGAPLPAGDR